MRYSATLVALAAATVSVAQNADIPKYESSLNMTLPNPGLVDLSERSDWCQAQYNTCRSLCEEDFKDNDCEESDLSYKCNCGNSSAPGLQYYTQTMPTFICKELFKECIDTHTGDSRAQALCKSNIDAKCATEDPPKEKSEDDDGDDNDDDDKSSTTASRQSSTSSSSKPEATEDKVSTTESDGYAAPTMAPAGNVAAVAAIGVLAYLV